jgi:hypothetical protein
MVNTRRKNQAAKGTSTRSGELSEEQPSANGPPPRQKEEIKIADPAQRMVTIEDGMNDLKEMIQKKAEEIEKINKEREVWQKQQL